MESYTYLTEDKKSYTSLIGILAGMDVTFTATAATYEASYKIVADYYVGELTRLIGAFIDDNALNFHIKPTESEEEYCRICKELKIASTPKGDRRSPSRISNQMDLISELLCM